MKARLLLVIPAYRESQRLPHFLPQVIDAIKAANLPVRLIIVDDGSGVDETVRLEQALESIVSPHDWIEPVHALPVNQGKGGAIYAGWDLAQEEEWLAFVDADGAVPAEEIVRLAALALQAPVGVDAVVGVRVHHAEHVVKRTWLRNLAGHTFRSLVRLLFHLPVPDTQCGLKFVRRSAWQAVRAQLTEMRFCFDVELLAHFHRRKVMIQPEPITWAESPGGTIRPLTHVEMFLTLLRLRRHFEETAPL
jgi:dolichyl-phosphate beta-glucosyltransferase